MLALIALVVALIAVGLSLWALLIASNRSHVTVTAVEGEVASQLVLAALRAEQQRQGPALRLAREPRQARPS